ncbi:conserved hypothetical protein [uncultured Pleomorphomonas sp.]|uniref:Uncharacterized protein n=1 Tax=uncultured Pleomorphomonas sp. TaxID=442121 RepID=A0A212LKH0_9HYPH|nr:conserved hypothetical protein [uncultured Pleomorphomonas sp.]SCM78023.1 conserved hypothetical protein [uncultured Pleomorphomonas sp.]
MLPIRAVEDHHVDRPGVEAQQCVKLTGTNSSIGLIALIIPVHPEDDTGHNITIRWRKTIAKDQMILRS